MESCLVMQADGLFKLVGDMEELVERANHTAHSLQVGSGDRARQTVWEQAWGWCLLAASAGQGCWLAI